MTVPFRIFRSFNDPSMHWAARSRFRLDRESVGPFHGDPLADRIVDALAARHAINVKELLESFEAFARLRRRLRAREMADLCCGHGLTGLLFAAAERRVERVVLMDRVKPPAASRVVEAVCEAAPWARDKIHWVEDDAERAARHLAEGTSILGIHACGIRTDRVLEAAVAVRGNVAVMPCCYAQTAKRAPKAIRHVLGAELTTDVHRTYWLEERGWRVEWSAIPEAITPMNRIIIGLLP